jgi:hypothetical protein
MRVSGIIGVVTMIAGAIIYADPDLQKYISQHHLPPSSVIGAGVIVFLFASFRAYAENEKQMEKVFPAIEIFKLEDAPLGQGPLRCWAILSNKGEYPANDTSCRVTYEPPLPQWNGQGWTHPVGILAPTDDQEFVITVNVVHQQRVLQTWQEVTETKSLVRIDVTVSYTTGASKTKRAQRTRCIFHPLMAAFRYETEAVPVEKASWKQSVLELLKSLDG